VISEQQKPDPYDIALAFATEHYLEAPTNYEKGWRLRWWRSGWYEYAGGCYYQITDAELKAKLVGYLRTEQLRVSPHFLNAILLCLTHLVMIPSDVALNSWLDGIKGADVIVGRNGNISLTDRDDAGRPRLLRHTPLYFTTSKLPYDYDPEATCPRFEKFLGEVMGGDIEYIELIEDLLGYLFVLGNPFQMFVLLLGSGANGKSTFLRLMEWVIDPSTVCHVPLARFGDRFSLYEMIGKRLNTVSETITAIDSEAEARLKELTGGDTVGAEIKHVQAHINFVPTAKIVIATNQMPAFRDPSAATWRRLYVIPFRITIADNRQDRALIDKLKGEAPGVLNLALRARDRLLKRGGFKAPTERAELLRTLRRQADPVREFLISTFEPSGNGDFVRSEFVHQAYTEWADLHGVPSVDERCTGKGIGPRTPSTPSII